MSRLRERLVKTQSQQTQKTLMEDDQFFTGRFRWKWILGAHRCRGGLVGMYLLRLGYMWKTDRLPVSTKRSAEILGVDRKTVYRQLDALERASLVAVDRHRGRWPVVYLLEDPVLRRVDMIKAKRPEPSNQRRPSTDSKTKAKKRRRSIKIEQFEQLALPI